MRTRRPPGQDDTRHGVGRYAIEHGPEEINRRPHLEAIKRLGFNREAVIAQCAGVIVRAPYSGSAKRSERLAGFAVSNEAEGLEVQLVDGKPLCFGTRSYTHITGDNKIAAVHIFARLFDYLAYLTLYGLTKPTGEAFILHRPSMVDQVITAIRTSKEPEGLRRIVVIWLGATIDGLDLTDRLLDACTRDGRQAAAQQYLYGDYHSLSEWYQATRPAKREKDPGKWYHDTAWNQVAKQVPNKPKF